MLASPAGLRSGARKVVLLAAFGFALLACRALWLSSSDSQACQASIRLGPSGTWEGPSWSTRATNDAVLAAWIRFSTNDVAPSIGLSPELIVELDKTKERLAAWGLDGSVKSSSPAMEIEALDNFDLTSGLVAAFTRIAAEQLSFWVRIPGVAAGLGKTGIIKPVTLKRMAQNEKMLVRASPVMTWHSAAAVQACCGHVKIINSTVYFRYASIITSRKKLQRFNLSIRMVQDAVLEYDLTGERVRVLELSPQALAVLCADMRAEFYLNVCDEPMSYDNSLAPGRAGFPVFSTQVTEGSTDIAYPDPLDLVEDGMVSPTRPRSWRRLEARAVYRSPSSVYDLKEGNTGANPQIRLHRMSDVRPDLLDARISMWGQSDQEHVKVSLVKKGFELGDPMDSEQLARYKYRLVVDDKVGSRHMCGALASHQLAIRQRSAFQQFYTSLLVPGLHYLHTEHSFQDLFPTIEWATEHDPQVRQMVANARHLARQVCTWKGRTLYWALLLHKYSTSAIEDPLAITVPERVCDGPPIFEAVAAEAACKVEVSAASSEEQQCLDYCIKDKDEAKWTWLTASSLNSLPRPDTLASVLSGVS
eukprot:SM000244S08552  [mRNA]  locus=s244:75671:79493:- [translate_table: standard]